MKLNINASEIHLDTDTTTHIDLCKVDFVSLTRYYLTIVNIYLLVQLLKQQQLISLIDLAKSLGGAT